MRPKTVLPFLNCPSRPQAVEAVFEAPQAISCKQASTDPYCDKTAVMVSPPTVILWDTGVLLQRMMDSLHVLLLHGSP